MVTQGMSMPTPGKRSQPVSDSEFTRLAERPQIDFEMDFFEELLTRAPDFAEVLTAQAGNFHTQGRLAEGLKVEERIVRLRPRDATAHYNLACRYARLQQRDKAIESLRRAVELGFRDFRSMTRDEDLASIRKDPRFRQIVSEYAGK